MFPIESSGHFDTIQKIKFDSNSIFLLFLSCYSLILYFCFWYDMQWKKGTQSCCFGNYIISLMWYIFGQAWIIC